MPPSAPKHDANVPCMEAQRITAEVLALRVLW